MSRSLVVSSVLAVAVFAHFDNGALGSLPADKRIAELIDIIEPPADTPGQVVFFGGTLSISGERLFIGAPNSDDEGVQNSGLGFVYDVGTRELLYTLRNPASGDLNYFGASAAPLGSDLVVGGADGLGNDIAFRFDGASGALLQTYARAPSANATGGFFSAVATTENEVYVAVVDGASDGKVFVFDADSGDLKATIPDPPPINSNDVFGASLVATDDSIFVGAFRDHTSFPNSGSVFVFDNLDHMLVDRISNPTPAGNDQFGISLALVGGSLTVGATFDDAAGADSGSAYLFDPVSGDLLRTFVNPSPDEFDAFGFSFAGVGDDLLISAVGDGNVGNGGGVVYQYDPLSGELVGALFSPSSEERRFGWALATAGNTVFVGDPINTGRVYVFRVIPEPHGLVLLALASACLPFAARRRKWPPSAKST